MPRKQDVRALMRKSLGKDVADAILDKVDKMARQGRRSADIEKVLLKELDNAFGVQVGKEVLVVVQSGVSRSVQPLSSVRVEVTVQGMPAVLAKPKP